MLGALIFLPSLRLLTGCFHFPASVANTLTCLLLQIRLQSNVSTKRLKWRIVSSEQVLIKLKQEFKTKLNDEIRSEQFSPQNALYTVVYVWQSAPHYERGFMFGKKSQTNLHAYHIMQEKQKNIYFGNGDRSLTRSDLMPLLARKGRCPEKAKYEN